MNGTPSVPPAAAAKRVRNRVPLLPEASKDAKRLAAVILEVWVLEVWASPPGLSACGGPAAKSYNLGGLGSLGLLGYGWRPRMRAAA